MELKQAIKILKDHNKWRRGGDGQMTHPKKLGIAIDTVVNLLDNPKTYPVEDLTDEQHTYYLKHGYHVGWKKCDKYYEKVVKELRKEIKRLQNADKNITTD